jgi:hypothetical protein
MKCSGLVLIVVLISFASVAAAGRPQGNSQKAVAANAIRGDEHYAIRDGLRIYLWEKHKAGLEVCSSSKPCTGKCYCALI